MRTRWRFFFCLLCTGAEGPLGAGLHLVLRALESAELVENNETQATRLPVTAVTRLAPTMVTTAAFVAASAAGRRQGKGDLVGVFFCFRVRVGETDGTLRTPGTPLHATPKG